MNLFLSISMSFIFLSQGLAVNGDLCHQIEKLSNFISHYQDHKKYDGDSFLEYTIEDYFSNDGDKEGHHEGSEKDKIPNHENHRCCNSIVFIANPTIFEIKPICSINKRQFEIYTSKFNSRYLETLFHPPKI